jgi:hypothetical protein
MQHLQWIVVVAFNDTVSTVYCLRYVLMNEIAKSQDFEGQRFLFQSYPVFIRETEEKPGTI